MKFMLMQYVREAGWGALNPTEQEEWLAIVRGYVEAMKAAGILRESIGLQWSSAATTVRTTDGRLQVLDGPYADTREQLGGAYIIEVADLDEAIAWASRSATAIHGVVEVRPFRESPL
ncbi:MAG: YciI family protein [Gemmatimonadota bacterium]